MLLDKVSFCRMVDAPVGSVVAFPMNGQIVYGFIGLRKVNPSGTAKWFINLDPGQGSPLGADPMIELTSFTSLDTLIIHGARFFPEIELGRIQDFSLSTSLYISGDQLFLQTATTFFGYYFSLEDGKEQETAPTPRALMARWKLQAKDPDGKWVEVFSRT